MLCPTKLVTEKETTIDHKKIIPITTQSTINLKVMIDCGAEGDFIDRTYATIMGIKKLALDKLIKV